jgi:hypothetical protein
VTTTADPTVDRRRYRKLFARLWADPDFSALTESEKLVAIYLLCGPQTNRVGLYKVSIATGAEHLSWRKYVFATRMRACVGQFSWEFDERATVLWIPSWWSYNNPGERESNFRGALTDLGEVPPTDLLAKFCNNLRDLDPRLHPFIQAWLPKGPREGSAPAQPLHSESSATAQVELQEKRRQERAKRRVQAAAPSAAATPDPEQDLDPEPELDPHQPTFALLERVAHTVLDDDPSGCTTDWMDAFHRRLIDAHLPRDVDAMHRALESASHQRELARARLGRAV